MHKSVQLFVKKWKELCKTVLLLLAKTLSKNAIIKVRNIQKRLGDMP